MRVTQPDLARCRTCRRYIQKAAKEEVLGSHIGPHARSMAVYLRNEIGITYRKMPIRSSGAHAPQERRPRRSKGHVTECDQM